MGRTGVITTGINARGFQTANPFGGVYSKERKLTLTY